MGEEAHGAFWRLGEATKKNAPHALERESAKVGIATTSPSINKESHARGSAQEDVREASDLDFSFNTASQSMNSADMGSAGKPDGGAMVAASDSEQHRGRPAVLNLQESRAHQAARLLEETVHEEHRPVLLTALLQKFSQGVNTKSGQVLSVAKSVPAAGSDGVPDAYVKAVTSGAADSLRRAADPPGAEILGDKIGRIDASNGYADFTDRTWIIRPSGQVRSITFNMTFLAIEKGFDFVIVSSCPDGKCSEVYRYK